MSAVRQKQSFDTIDALLRQLNKEAEESHTEAGGYAGPTEHPVKKEDDGTEEASTGSRARENEEDVKKDQGEPGVDGEPVGEAKSAARKRAEVPSDQDAVQLNIGTKQRATGEDPENETNRAKGGKEDGGYQGASSHPARTDNDEIDGHKWASSLEQVRTLSKTAQERGNAFLASLSVSADESLRSKAAQIQKEQRAPADTKTAEAASAPAAGAAAVPAAAKQAGAALAGAMLEGTVPESDKQAQFMQVVNDIADTVITAYRMADKTAAFLQGVEDRKQANDESGEEKKDDGSEGGEAPGGNPPSDGSGSEGPPEESGGGEPGGAGGGEADLLAALGGGGAAPGGPPGGSMGGGDPLMGGGPPPGGDPMMGGGGPPGGGMGMGGPPGGGMGGGMVGPEELAILAAVLQQAGISPEQLAMAAQAKQASYLAARAKQAAALPAKAWTPKTAQEAQRFQNLMKTVTELTALGA